MSSETDTRDRVIRLETTVETMAAEQAKMARKVDEMHSLLQQARGARWALIGAATIGGFVSAKLAPFLPSLTK